MNEHMSDKDFADYCLKLGGFQIFQLIKYLDEPNEGWVNTTKKEVKDYTANIIRSINAT